MVGFLPQQLKLRIYHWKPLARIIRNGLNLFAPDGLVQVEVSGGHLKGVSMLLDLKKEKDYWLGTYEPDFQKAISKHVNKGMVVYDVGANIGYTSLLFAQAVGETGKVFAFEALPNNVLRLRDNKQLNLPVLGQRIEVIPSAVVDSEKQVEFLIGPSPGTGKVDGSAGRQRDIYSESILVNGISLDEFVFEGGNATPDIVKIDVEGGEGFVINGMGRIMEQVRPTIMLEIHGSEAASVVLEALKSADYFLQQLQSGSSIIRSLDELSWKSYVVALPEIL